MEYIAAQPGLAAETIQQYRKLNHPMTKRQNKERLVNVLRSEIQHRQSEGGDDWWDDLDTIADQVADHYHDTYYKVQDDFHTSIYQTHVYDAATRDTDIFSGPDSTEFYNIHPVNYPVWELHQADSPAAELHHADSDSHTDELHHADSDTEEPRMDVVLDASAAADMAPAPVDSTHRRFIDEDGPRTITMITTRLDTRRDLADTGATISATGIKSILHRFQSYSDYEIKGYDGKTTKAAGQGYAMIYNPVTKQTDDMLFVYTPMVNGTIISLEHHAKTHPRIHKWTQEATPSDDRGRITFLAADGTVVSEYPTTRSQGLYYIQDLHFVPAPPYESPPGQEPLGTPDTGPRETLSVMRIQPLETRAPMESDYTPDIDTEHYQQLLQDQRTPATTINVTTATTSADRMAREVLKYELWHQRMGHAPLSRLIRTSPHVQGLPNISPTQVPSFVTCRACEIAKLKKAPRGNPTADPVDLQTGQYFHMDLGFIRGPANLQAVVDREAEAQPKIIHSRQGYTCYLLIVDRKLRYMWVFPLRSRSVSIDLMDGFLSIHGNKQVHPRMIRTDGEGSLAESEDFRNLLSTHRYLLPKWDRRTPPSNIGSDGQVYALRSGHASFILGRCTAGLRNVH